MALDAKDGVRWSFHLNEPGLFEVEINYACSKGCGGSVFDIEVGDGTLEGTTRATGTWDRYASEVLGRVRLEEPGAHTLTVQPRAEPTWRSMGLKSIVLRPVR
jgi:hypothetical protein